jgi:ABC-type phosphate transport system substrate-binding protein
MAFFSRRSGLSALALATLMGGMAGLPNAASALEPEFGAGATLPAGLYRDWFNCYGLVIPNTTRPAGCPSTVNRNFEYLYAGVGSGAGLAAFLAKRSPTVTPTAPTNPIGVVTVSDRPKGYSYPYRSYEFSGSDAILTPQQQAAYDSTLARRYGPNIQIPSVATSVTMPYNPALLSLQRTADDQPVLYLSRRSYCGIFTGAITNWNHPSLTADNGGQLSANLPIRVHVRADSSGTTDLLTRHLDAVCTGDGASGYNWNGGVGTTVAWPARLREVEGISGVVDGIRSTRGAIGYISPEYTRVAPTPSIPNPPPVANLQNQADINAFALAGQRRGGGGGRVTAARRRQRRPLGPDPDQPGDRQLVGRRRLPDRRLHLPQFLHLLPGRQGPRHHRLRQLVHDEPPGTTCCHRQRLRAAPGQVPDRDPQPGQRHRRLARPAQDPGRAEGRPLHALTTLRECWGSGLAFQHK